MSARIEARPGPVNRLDGLLLGAGDLDHAVAERGDEAFEVEGDQRLVLDDDDVGGELAGDLAAGFVDEPLQLDRADVHRHGGILGRELLGGHQQEGLPGRRRQAGKIAVRRLEARRMTVVPVSLPVPLDGVEHSQERAVEGDARLDAGGEYGGVGQQGLERHGDVGIPALLAAGNHPGETAQIRQMGCNLLCERHIRHPLLRLQRRLRGLPAPRQ